nr:protein FAR1-RELATED SEQUENCE 5-like [Ipomoea trifida]
MGPSDDTVEMQTTDMEESVDVPKYWMATCDPSLKPVVGQRFESLESGIKFYIKLNGEVYEVVSFEKRHTHDLCGDSYKPFMKVNRKLDIGHQHFIANCAKANIGPRGGDAQMVLSNYIEKKLDCDDFYFEYEVNDKDQLSRVFWADGVARKQFSVFGEAMAFDATYQTNNPGTNRSAPATSIEEQRFWQANKIDEGDCDQGNEKERAYMCDMWTGERT